MQDRCILLIEDVDAAFIQREKGEGTTANNVTFSGIKLHKTYMGLIKQYTIGLLNAIDGVAAQEGRILCMTTK